MLTAVQYADDKNILRKGLEMQISVSEMANEAGGSWLKCLLPGLFWGFFLVRFTSYSLTAVFACLLSNTRVQAVRGPPGSLSTLSQAKWNTCNLYIGIYTKIFWVEGMEFENKKN